MKRNSCISRDTAEEGEYVGFFLPIQILSWPGVESVRALKGVLRRVCPRQKHHHKRKRKRKIISGELWPVVCEFFFLPVQILSWPGVESVRA